MITILHRLIGFSGLQLAVALMVSATGARELHQTVSFVTSDDGVVFADIFGTGPRGLLLAHGGRFTKESWADQAPQFAAAGFRVMAIDFRGRGESRGGPQAGSADDVHLDVLAAVRYLREHGANSVAVVGASFGGGAAARAVISGLEKIDSVVLLAHSSVEHPELLTGRKLFILARDDTDGGGNRRLDAIRRQFALAPEPKELVVLEGSAHAQFLFGTEQGPQLMREILRFLNAP